MKIVITLFIVVFVSGCVSYNQIISPVTPINDVKVNVTSSRGSFWNLRGNISGDCKRCFEGVVRLNGHCS